MTPMNECLACGGNNLKLCFDLGEQPLANNYDTDEKYPLALNYCDDCYHAQLTVSVDPEKLYRNYYYVSGTSNTLRQWFSDFADRFTLPGKVLDIASNDGSLLLEFQKRGWEVLGFDPAENIDTQGIHTIHSFFGEKTELADKYDLITAFNVVAHNPDPISIMRGIYNNLADGGVAYVMTSQGSMFENGQFDTVYHEHHSFFSLNSFQELANRAGFTDITCTIEPIHGGSYLFRLTKSENKTQLPQNRPDFEGFREKVLSKRPYRLVGFGAAAKGVVMINALGQKLDYIVDEAPLKIGKKIPGTDINIVHPDTLVVEPDNLIVIVYAWNFYDEIVSKIKALRPDREDIFIRYYS